MSVATEPLYLRPTSLEEAVAALAEHPGARPVAGGTDLMIQLRLGVGTAPSAVVDTADVLELHGVDPTPDGGLRIGAATPLRTLLGSPATARYPALAQACRLLGGPQIQAMASLGGNLANGSPAAETATPLLVHDAEVEVAGPGGRRTVALTDLWLGPRRTAVSADELIVAVTLPAPTSGTTSAYHRLELRRSVDIAVVSASVRLTLDAAGTVADARVAIGAAAPTPRRVPEAEALLVGATPRAAATAAGAAAREAASPIDDTRAGAAYRAAMVAEVTERAVHACTDDSREDT
ncbi:xanthine dehydrogenase family protein subunit M [Nocardioides marinquilinus]|uniref:Xanthine dehydrogenase family protein subunit M n=1 Tax=Nocardioides marinquilinus TaxID=1210400 RepID=A0ABP9PDX8_9ACTN